MWYSYKVVSQSYNVSEKCSVSAPMFMIDDGLKYDIDLQHLLPPDMITKALGFRSPPRS